MMSPTQPIPEDRAFRPLSPRPFALHLTLAMAALSSSKAGLPPWSGGSPNSSAPDPGRPDPGRPNPRGAFPPESLATELARFDPPAISAAIDRAMIAQAAQYAAGIEAYRSHPYRRADEAGAPVARFGGTSLLRHDGTAPGGAGTPALFVPSLLNRGWVLDLVPGQGMLSWLADHGVAPYRIEWGAPGPVERRFGIGDYVRHRLEPAIDEVRRLTGRAPVLVGYCMGGLLALAAALGGRSAVAGLVLLATPWDFEAGGGDRAAAIATFYRSARPFLQRLEELPVDIIQALFTTHDPIVALRKFRRFAAMDPASAEAKTFVALEDWLNDGVALALPAADEALLGWYASNTTARGLWRVAGDRIDPADLEMPSLVFVPGADRIVPPLSAAAIVPSLRGCERRDVPLGHIGMVVGGRARDAVWAPLAEWIRARAVLAV